MRGTAVAGMQKRAVHTSCAPLVAVCRGLISFGLLGLSRSESKGAQHVSAKDCSTVQSCNVQVTDYCNQVATIEQEAQSQRHAMIEAWKFQCDSRCSAHPLDLRFMHCLRAWAGWPPPGLVPVGLLAALSPWAPFTQDVGHRNLAQYHDSAVQCDRCCVPMAYQLSKSKLSVSEVV